MENLKNLYPITAVFAVVMVKEGFVLVHDKDKPAPILYKNPGGMIEPGETPFQALERELTKEECRGLPVGSAKELFVADNHKRGYSVMFYFISEPEFSVAEIEAGGEVDILKAVSRKELETMLAYGDIVPQHAAAIGTALRKFL